MVNKYKPNRTEYGQIYYRHEYRENKLPVKINKHRLQEASALYSIRVIIADPYFRKSRKEYAYSDNLTELRAMAYKMVKHNHRTKVILEYHKKTDRGFEQGKDFGEVRFDSPSEHVVFHKYSNNLPHQKLKHTMYYLNSNGTLGKPLERDWY